MAATSPRRPVPLRRQLWLLAALAILPLAAVGGLVLQTLLQQQLAQTERAALGLSRALATAVDNELRLSISALQVLALNDAMAATDQAGLAGAHELARRVHASRPEWRGVILARPSGEIVFNTAAEFGAVLPPVAEPASLAQVVRTAQPAVGTIASGPGGNYGVAIRVPVLREGQVLYALTAILRPEAVLAVVARQRVPEDWIVSVFDSSLQRVARSRDSVRMLAKPPSQTLRALIAQMGDQRQTYGQTETLEGHAVHRAVARLEAADWLIALGIPTSESRNAVNNSALAYGGGLLLSVLLGGLAAWLLSRQIQKPIAGLRNSAMALGSGEPVQAVPSEITEIQAMSDALVAAGAVRKKGEDERQSLLEAEREARALAEKAEQRLRLLVSAGAMLANSLEESSTLKAIAALIVPSVADACRIDLLDHQGVLQRKITHHVDPVRRQALEDFVRNSVAPDDTAGTFPWAMKTGKTYLANFPDPDNLPFKDPSVREFARIVGLRAALVVPLIARGQTIGAMAVMQAESGRNLTDDDAALIGELAQRAALALDNVRLFAELRAALREASVASRAKDDFFAVLGHELRNPLAPIVSSLEAMARHGGDAHLRERRVIDRQVRHLLRLVDDLLDISRISSGKVELHRELVDLRDVAARAVELTAPAMKGRLAPTVQAEDGPLVVHGDATRLTQVVCNLLINAAKFSNSDEPISISIERDAAKQQLRVRVTDHGMGISSELLPRVFERFVQGEQSLHRAAGGLGLGLAIARNLVELHGGSIEAHSAGPGMGSCFTVALPLSAAEPTTQPVAAALPAVGLPQRVLIVDDNIDAADALADLLTLEGCEVRTAASAPQALALLQDWVPQAAVLDIGLPGMDGYELARRLRADARLVAIRLVALTGYGHETDKQRALDAGFDVHLVKPIELDKLAAILGEPV
ncbi:MAG TPA: ATP-binding protein [Rubrivivax sp.]|nr:ATP-binding protein [Rubrivivax sp.]